MRQPEWTATVPEHARLHLADVAANLQLVADLGYGDAALAVPGARGALVVVADARPSTAADPIAASRAGRVLTREAEPEAYTALEQGHRTEGKSRHVGGFHSIVEASPIGSPDVVAVVLRTYGEHMAATPSRMERAFIDSARDLLDALREGPLLDAQTGEPYATTRRAGDGVLRVSRRGRITYASPNAVTIMRLAGVEGRVTGMNATELPGGGLGISPLLGAAGALTTEMEVAGRVLSYRTLVLAADALVLVEDLTEPRRRERELDIMEATIREVHHRVKNNLQTIASLLRIQARRSDNPEVHEALNEATERASAMATVHDLLARSGHERVDFAEAARRVVDLVRSGMVGTESRITVSVEGATGQIDASTATSLALTLAELVHNALEHAYAPEDAGAIRVVLRRAPGELVMTVCDDGRGLAPGFDPGKSRGLGFSIMRTLIEEDLRGSLVASSEGHTCITVRVPVAPDEP